MRSPALLPSDGGPTGCQACGSLEQELLSRLLRQAACPRAGFLYEQMAQTDAEATLREQRHREERHLMHVGCGRGVELMTLAQRFDGARIFDSSAWEYAVSSDRRRWPSACAAACCALYRWRKSVSCASSCRRVTLCAT